MPHIPGHTEPQPAQYKVVGTNVLYSGKVIMIAGDPFTTNGGGIEGDNQRLESIKAFGDDLGLDDFDLSLPSPSRLTNQNNSTRGFGDDLGLDDYDANRPPTTMSNTSNPVTRTFVSRVAYYTRDGSTVNPGTELHQHADGTVMLGHDPNNMGAIVTTNQTINRTTRQTQRGTQTSTSTRQTTRRTQTRTGTMNTRRSTGGGGY